MSGPLGPGTSRFTEDLDQALSAWKDTWARNERAVSGVSPGPMFLRGIVREHMTSEALEAQQPEDEAYARFIQTAVNGIVCATQLGRHRQAIEDLSTVLDFGLPPTVRRADQPRISTDILQGVVEQLAVPSPTE